MQAFPTSRLSGDSKFRIMPRPSGRGFLFAFEISPIAPFPMTGAHSRAAGVAQRATPRVCVDFTEIANINSRL